eukprot:3868011-Rhodomonas_salina.1
MRELRAVWRHGVRRAQSSARRQIFVVKGAQVDLRLRSGWGACLQPSCTWRCPPDRSTAHHAQVRLASVT